MGVLFWTNIGSMEELKISNSIVFSSMLLITCRSKAGLMLSWTLIGNAMHFNSMLEIALTSSIISTWKSTLDRSSQVNARLIVLGWSSCHQWSLNLILLPLLYCMNVHFLQGINLQDLLMWQDSKLKLGYTFEWRQAKFQWMYRLLRHKPWTCNLSQ